MRKIPSDSFPTKLIGQISKVNISKNLIIQDEHPHAVGIFAIITKWKSIEVGISVRYEKVVSGKNILESVEGYNQCYETK